MKPPPPPTAWQVRRTRAVTRWYLERYHGTDDDPGVARMFTDPGRVGSFAVREEALRDGEPGALAKLLVATVMFQKRSDLQIMRVLRGISPDDAEELTDLERLRGLARESGCPHHGDLAALLTRCDLTKHPTTKLGTCAARPSTACSLKRHTVLLKRYGHFGKVPTSIALAVSESGASDLSDLLRRCTAEGGGPEAAALRVEAALTRAWRVSDKIAAMYLSMLCNPDLCPGLAPWVGALDHRRFVVIDSNVDLYLRAVGYPGPWTYGARRAFIQSLSARVDLPAMKPGLSADNPRIVQQAMYLFMSESHRRSIARDCSHEGPAACAACPAAVRGICPRRRRG